MGIASIIYYAAPLALIVPAHASDLPHSEPPYIRTGSDVVAMCDVSSEALAYRCEGMIDAIADRTEAKRWADECPPSIILTRPGSIPGDVWAMLNAAREHPDWLKLTADQFIDRVHRVPCKK